MLIKNIIEHLEIMAPPIYQEVYDNSGLITGVEDWQCRGALICLDATEKVINEAICRNCNLVVAHHPIVFSGLKKLNGKNYIEQAVITAIKNDIAIYAFHTNIDNIKEGVNGKIADMLDLENRSVLQSRAGTLKKLYTFIPVAHAEQVSKAVFMAGGGQIGNYSECSFSVEGVGSFTAGTGAHPYAGKQGQKHYEKEMRLEVIFPANLEKKLIEALLKAHPYEEVAYDVIALANEHPGIGSGLIGELNQPMNEQAFLQLVKERFKLRVIRHTPLLHKAVKRIAICGGSGSFLIPNALALRADVFITADITYHTFFDANERMVVADIGHYESERFTIDLIHDVLQVKFPTFALLKTECNTNPVNYFLG